MSFVTALGLVVDTGQLNKGLPPLIKLQSRIKSQDYSQETMNLDTTNFFRCKMSRDILHLRNKIRGYYLIHLH